MLREARVRRLVDVRTKPGSRRHPQFGQAALTAILEEAGIAYRWESDLGGFRRARPDSPHVALAEDGLRGYADHMGTAAFAEALRRLIEDAGREPTACMCAETLWTNCHRRMLADALTVAGTEVVHLIETGISEPHRLDPALSVVDGCLIYDGQDRAQERFDLS